MNSAPDKPLSRIRSSGRFMRRARWREANGLPVLRGRRSAVTAELAAVAVRLLREGSTVAEMCRRIGVDKRSWYRWVRARPESGVRVRAYRRVTSTRRIPDRIVRQMVRLERQGLTRSAIAQRLGLHLNTVVKHMLRVGRPRKVGKRVSSASGGMR